MGGQGSRSAEILIPVRSTSGSFIFFRDLFNIHSSDGTPRVFSWDQPRVDKSTHIFIHLDLEAPFLCQVLDKCKKLKQGNKLSPGHGLRLDPNLANASASYSGPHPPCKIRVSQTEAVTTVRLLATLEAASVLPMFYVLCNLCVSGLQLRSKGLAYSSNKCSPDSSPCSL